MKKTIILFLLIFAFIIQQSNSQGIYLKKKFWSGWNYSIDDGELKPVGFSAEPLKKIMADNEECMKKLESYETANIMGLLFIIPGLILGAINLAEDVDGDTDKPSTEMYIMAAALWGASLGADEFAKAELKEAVRIYNSDHSAFGFNIGFERYNNKYNGRIELTLSFKF